MDKIKLKLISPEGTIFESSVEEVVLPTSDGEVAILAHHKPLILTIEAGEIVIKDNGKIHQLVSEGGVAEIGQNTINIIADTAEDVESLNELKILEAKERAETRLKNAIDDEDFAEAQSQLAKQLTKLNILTKRKRKH